MTEPSSKPTSTGRQLDTTKVRVKRTISVAIEINRDLYPAEWSLADIARHEQNLPNEDQVQYLYEHAGFADEDKGDIDCVVEVSVPWKENA